MPIPIIVYSNSRMCGKVDVVPGICYVATSFECVLGIPVLSERSYVLLKTPMKGFRGVQLPFSWGTVKSILMGYFRTLLVIVAALCGLLCIFLLALRDIEPSVPLIETAAIGIGSALLFGLTVLFNRASKRRAAELIAAFGIPPDVVETIMASGPDGATVLSAYLIDHKDVMTR